MPRFTDPAPCEEGDQRFECPDCGGRVCRDEGPVVCDCGTTMRNIGRPRAE